MGRKDRGSPLPGGGVPGFGIRACALVVCASASLFGLASSATAGTAGTRPDAVRTGRLSNERTVTRWAHPKREAVIRKHPTRSSHPIVRMHKRTEDGLREVYLLLRSWTDPHGRNWVHIRIPMRPNGQTGWVRGSALGRMHLVRTHLVVDRRHLSAVLYRRGRKIWRSGIGIGKPSTPTPGGHFWIRERLRVQDPHGLYGPWAFGTSAYARISDWPKGGVVGIHGTNEPGLIPGRPSHGCIRMRNRAISRLVHRMPIGTPVRIR